MDRIPGHKQALLVSLVLVGNSYSSLCMAQIAPASSEPASRAAQTLASAAAPLNAATLKPFPGGTWEPGPRDYGSLAPSSGSIRMDDGVVLNAEIFYPADLHTGQRAAGKFPVVIEHTPYVIEQGRDERGRYLVEHGYIYAKVFARGTSNSGGELQMHSPRDGKDGARIIDWAARRLTGSDGRIALIGCSWPGGLALAGLAFVGPNSPVKAVVSACVGLGVVQRQAWLVGGMPTALFGFLAKTPTVMGNTPASARFFDRVVKQVADGEDPAYDRDFWRERLPLSWASRIADTQVPILLWGGWRDIGEAATFRTYTSLQNAFAKRPLDLPMTAAQRITPKYQIVVGDWAHTQGLEPSIYLEWLETWVKGVDTGLQKSTTPMHLYERGTHRWINLTGYPVTGATHWWLGSGGEMLQSAPSRSSERTLRFGDPNAAEGKLSYESPALAAGATLAGPISATVYARSSNANLALIAKLYDLAPDGSRELISTGAMVGSQSELDPANSWRDASGAYIWPWPKQDRDVALKAGSVNRFEVALLPRQWGFKPGHRIGFEFTTQNPKDSCPLPGRPPVASSEICGLTAPQQATLPGGIYTVLYGPQYPTTLNLPQLPFNVFKSVRAGSIPAEERTDPASQQKELPLDWGS